MKRLVSFSLAFTLLSIVYSQEQPLQIGVIGLTHTHVHWIFGSDKTHSEFQIAGIVEQNKVLAKRYSEQYDFPMGRIYDSMEELISNQEIDAVTAFGTIYDHVEIVEFAAPRGIHVMVEKPLAVNMKHAKKLLGWLRNSV